MSTKTTFKRIALVAVAALGFGVLATAPSQADVTNLAVTVADGTATTMNSDSSTAAVISLSGLGLASVDSVTVAVAQRTALPTGASITGAALYWTDSTTTTAGKIAFDTLAATSAGAAAGTTLTRYTRTHMSNSVLRVISSATNNTFSAKLKFDLGETATQSYSVGSTIKAGTYGFTLVVTQYSGSSATVTTRDFNIVVSAVAAESTVASAALATAYLQAGSSFINGTTDSVTTGANTVSTNAIGVIRVNNYNASKVGVADTITVSIAGPGILDNGTSKGRSLIYMSGTGDNDISVLADGNSGEATISITTGAGATFTKKVTFFDSKPATATVAVKKAYILAGTSAVSKVFAVTVKDSAGNAVTNATVTAAPTDTATTVGGAATCGSYDTTDKVYYCSVAGLSSLKFGPVAYTVTVTGADTAKTKLTASATTTFSAGVAAKITLTGPATAEPNATVSYTLTMTDANGYPVADQSYNGGSANGSTGGAIFGKATVSTGFSTAPQATYTDTVTTVSGVATIKGVVPSAGVATATLTLAGDGTGTTDAVATALEGTTLVVTTAVSNPAIDAATDAANEATDAANAATDAANAAAEAADAATAAAQDAADAVAALSTQVNELISALKKQITSLTSIVVKIQKKLGVK